MKEVIESVYKGMYVSFIELGKRTDRADTYCDSRSADMLEA